MSERGKGSKGGKGGRRGSMPASDYSGAAGCATTTCKLEACAAPTVLFVARLRSQPLRAGLSCAAPPALGGGSGAQAAGWASSAEHSGAAS